MLSFEIRHALNDGDPFAPTSGLIEQGLFAMVGILFSLVLMELNARRADPLYFFASLGFGALTLAQTIAGLLLWENPYFSGDAIEGGALFNGLIPGYCLPALAALILALPRARPPARMAPQGGGGGRDRARCSPMSIWSCAVCFRGRLRSPMIRRRAMANYTPIRLCGWVLEFCCSPMESSRAPNQRGSLLRRWCR